MSADERRSVLLARLERDQRKFVEHCDNVTATRDAFLVDQAWELRDIIADSYDTVRRATQALEDLDV